MNGNPSKEKLNRERGFTLLEMIITVAILGLIATIGTIAIANTIKRQRVDVAAQDLRSFMQTAQERATQARTTVFVRIVLANDEVQIATDSAGATVLARWPIPDSINLSTVAVGALECNWPLVTGTAIPALGCTPLGITVDPNTGRQVTALMTLALTHTEMVEGGLHPRIRYDLVLSPLWKTDANRELY